MTTDETQNGGSFEFVLLIFFSTFFVNKNETREDRIVLGIIEFLGNEKLWRNRFIIRNHTYRIGITESDATEINRSVVTHGSVWFAERCRIRVGGAFRHQNGQGAE